MSIQLIIVVLYVIALFAISAYAQRQATQGNESFVLAGRNLGTLLVAVNVAGLAIGGASTIGVAENAFTVGMAASWYNVAWSIGAVCMGIVAAAKYRALNITTIPELFERYYDTRARVIAVIGQIIIQMVITSLQYVAGGAILSSLMPEIFSFQGGMLASAVVFISITLMGGLLSAGLSNILNVVLIYFGIIVGAILVVNKQGGLAHIQASLPPTIDWVGPIGGLPVAVIVGWVATMCTQALSVQPTVQIACGAKDEKVARNGFLWGAALIFPIGFFCAAMGLAARVAYPNIKAAMAMPKVIMELHPVLSGITLASLWAADVSTAITLLLGAATLVSQDICKRFIDPNMSDIKQLKITRIAVFALGLFTLFLAFNAIGIVKTLLIGLSLTTAYTVIFLFTIFLPGLCRKSSAFYTTLIGIGMLVLWQFVPAIRIFPHPIYLEWIVCVGTFLTVAIFDRNPVSHIVTASAS
jgi:solute:Na+ symporter, SSS family